VAVPRFIDLSDEAGQAAVEGVAGSLSSASAINYAAFKAGSADYENINDCEDVASALQGGLPADYSISGGAVAEDDSVVCEVEGPEGNTADFQAIGTD